MSITIEIPARVIEEFTPVAAVIEALSGKGPGRKIIWEGTPMEEDPMDTPGTVGRVTYKGMDSLPSLLCVQTAPSEWTRTPFPREWRLPKPNPASVKNDWARPKPMPCFLRQLPVA